MFLNKIHQHFDGNGRTFKTLFANDDIIRQKYITKIKLYIKHNLIVLLELQKKYRKEKSKSCNDKSWKNNAFVTVCSA